MYTNPFKHLTKNNYDALNVRKVLGHIPNLLRTDFVTNAQKLSQLLQDISGSLDTIQALNTQIETVGRIADGSVADTAASASTTLITQINSTLFGGNGSFDIIGYESITDTNGESSGVFISLSAPNESTLVDDVPINSPFFIEFDTSTEVSTLKGPQTLKIKNITGDSVSITIRENFIAVSPIVSRPPIFKYTDSLNSTSYSFNPATNAYNITIPPTEIDTSYDLIVGTRLSSASSYANIGFTTNILYTGTIGVELQRDGTSYTRSFGASLLRK